MTVEVTTFKLAPGVTEPDFLAADAEVQTSFAYLQPGLVRRTTARGEGGEWLVVTLWSSAPDAEAAASRSDQDPAARAFWALVDRASVTTRRYETLD